MGLEVLILLRGRWEPEELELPETMVCNVMEENTLLVPLPLRGPRYYPCENPPLEYAVPGKVPQLEFEVILSDWESGGLEKGRATILCGWRGERLKPEYVRRVPLPCQENALFYSKGHVRITAYASGEVLLEKFTPLLDEEKRRIEVKREVLWKGFPPLPPQLKGFEEAVKAAMEKARCQGCREIHYADFG
ncbi:MAG: hypothetical protein QXG22_06515 [Candidatus Hadarchaeales archaeon]